MEYAYGAADVIVSRAGAMAISELSLIGKPAILVPYPFASEDHQTHNALSLVNAGAAILITDSNAHSELKPALAGLLDDPEKQSSLAKNLLELAKPDAADHIVEEILKLVGR
jgi:UDP-N-acetylglucosamine--N-acetylmuramyl-(pentapeptide) pyrophosphoryl-undecaprenol N-acetylglucosamine transferase